MKSPDAGGPRGRITGIAVVQKTVATAALGLALWATHAPGSIAGPPDPPRTPAPTTPSAVPFVRSLRIRLSPEARESLRRLPRQWVPAEVELEGHAFPSVAVRLKGSRGSFRTMDDRPGLTLDFDRLVPGQSSPWGPRLHLDNAVEDPSFLHAWLGAGMFQSAGLPAPRTGHAVVSLDGRRMGLYVLREGVTPTFLARHFGRGDGPVHDTDDTAPDLAPLRDAAAEADPVRRWERLGGVLDLDRFLTFLAMEVLLGHHDGYGVARNNFRIYHEPAGGRFHFLPHGMDQLLTTADFPWRPEMGAPVARAVLAVPEGRRRYEARFRELFGTLFVPDALEARARARAKALEALLTPAETRGLREATEHLVARIRARHAALTRQLSTPAPVEAGTNDDTVALSGWMAVDVPDGGLLDVVQLGDVGPALHVRAGPRTDASWRARVRLPTGRYRLVGRVRTAGIRPWPFGRGQGAMLRIAGGPRPAEGLLGDTSWQRLEHAFDVDGPVAEVEVVCEVRSTRGEAWFDGDSLRIEKVR